MVKINKILVLFLSMFVLCSLNAETNSLISVKGLLNYLKNKTDSYGSMAYQSSNNINVVTGNFQKVYLNLDTSFSNTPPLIPSVYRNLIQSPSIVTVNQDQVIYQVSVDSINTVSNDVTGLDFSGYKEASWEVWVNYTTTNSLSTIWDSRISWDIEVPELTVTGMYKFAFSSINGLEIRGKQVYPTIYPWMSNPSVFGTGIYSSGAGGDFGNLNAGVTSIYVSCPVFYGPLYFSKFTVYPNNPTVNDRTYFFYISVGNNNNIFSTNTILPVTTGYTEVTTMGYGVQMETKHVGRYAVKIEPSTGLSVNTTLWRLSVRPANELEIKAYNAGWRP